MTKRIAIYLLLAATLMAVIYYILTSPFVVERIATAVLKKNLKDYKLEAFTIGRQQWLDPSRVLFSDVKVRLSSKNDFYRVAAARVECTLRPAPIKVDIAQLTVESSQIVAQPGEVHINVYLKGWALDHFEGRAQVPAVEAYHYQLRTLTSDFQGTDKRLSLKNLKADVYQGKLFGEISLDWAKNLPYSMDVRFDGVDLRRLKDANPSYAEVEGVLSGSIEVNGNTVNFDTIDLKAKINKDGKVNASLLKFIAPYIPRTQESLALDEMMKRGEKIPVEIAVMELRSIDTHKISGFIKLLVGKLNLDLNLPIDILYDGNLISLIQWYQKLKS